MCDEAAGDRVALRGPDQHGMRAVAFDLEVEHGGAANLREKLRKRANGHLHGQVFTLGGVEHAGDEFFLTARRLAPLPRPARFCTLSTLRSDMDVLLTLPREKSRGGRFAEMSRCPGGRRRGFFPFARERFKSETLQSERWFGAPQHGADSTENDVFRQNGTFEMFSISKAIRFRTARLRTTRCGCCGCSWREGWPRKRPAASSTRPNVHRTGSCR